MDEATTEELNGLDIAEVSAGYNGGVCLEGITIAIKGGEALAIVGANGAGKTSLLRAISRLSPPKMLHGSIRFGDVVIDRLHPWEVAGIGIGHVPENRQVFKGMSVLDNLLVGGKAGTKGGDVRRDRLEETFRLFPKLRDRRRQLAGTLSGGEQQMLAIARSWMGAPRLLLIDEPSLGLAPLVRTQVYEWLAEMRAISGVTMVIVEEDFGEVRRAASRYIVLADGQIAVEGSMSDLGNGEQLLRKYMNL